MKTEIRSPAYIGQPLFVKVDHELRQKVILVTIDLSHILVRSALGTFSPRRATGGAKAKAWGPSCFALSIQVLPQDSLRSSTIAASHLYGLNRTSACC